jgi:hypothetical protein
MTKSTQCFGQTWQFHFPFHHQGGHTIQGIDSEGGSMQRKKVFSNRQMVAGEYLLHMTSCSDST